MPQEIALVTLVVKDYDEAIDFYTNRFGFVLIEDTDLGNGKRWVRVAPKGGATAILLAKATTPAQAASIGQQAGGRVFLFLQTDDFWMDYRGMTARGISIVREPREEPYGTVAVLADLYGNQWDLIQLTSSV